MSKQRQIRNNIQKISESELRDVVKNAPSLKAILEHLNLSTRTENYHRLRQKLRELNIDFSHIKLGAINVKKSPSYNPKNFDINDFLIENSTITRNSLKRHLLKLKILENKCAICSLIPEWQGRPLVLHIDHINGIADDNRLSNLRMLCPNCHSQTPTFSGKSIRLSRQDKKILTCKCGVSVSKEGVDCMSCYREKSSFAKRKVIRPSKEELQQLLWQVPTTQIAKIFGVSGTAIKKWARTYGVSKPPRGYWRKVEVGKI